MPEVFVGIGSNIQPDAHIRKAVGLLRTHFGELRLSPVYRNPAVGFVGEDFLNLVVAFESHATVTELRATLDAIEAGCGRVRGSPRFAPRTLDLDLLMVGDLITDTPPRLPRPEILEYAFVLKPLADLSADLRHPKTGRSMAQHWRDFRAASQKLIPVQLKNL
jgi:2-amino-4-hydroxy-6-hydroxymethyldihydropteridine diphosphokinase